MNHSIQRSSQGGTHPASWRASRWIPALVVGFVGSACEMSVDLPHLLTDTAIEGSGTAELQVLSAMAVFEGGAQTLGYLGLGHEDVMEQVAGVGSGNHRYSATFAAGLTGATSMTTARAMISTAPDRLVPSASGLGRGVYDRLQDEWTLGSEGERLSAIAAIYMAGTLMYMGEFFCEAALDESDLLTPGDLLGLAEEWITDRALVHVASFGDFAMPNSAAPSARNMALALRARIRWANGDLAGASLDAQTVLGSDQRFNSWITSEQGQGRENRVFGEARTASLSGMYGINDWWDPSIHGPNPVTGEPWPSPIPHTGYIFLGIMPDGRALEAGNVPVRWAQEERGANENPVPLNNGAVVDTRIEHEFDNIQGPQKRELPFKFKSLSDDIPLVSWRELTLIQADHQLAQGNLPQAIALANQLRSFHGLPLISGAYETALLGDATAVRHMLLEERRREFFTEGGRFWSTKIQNPDVLWFPRNQGQTPFQGYQLLGGVRLIFAGAEYEQNAYFRDRGGLTARGSGCEPGQRPIL